MFDVVDDRHHLLSDIKLSDWTQLASPVALSGLTLLFQQMRTTTRHPTWSTVSSLSSSTRSTAPQVVQ
jgi:hypothetical protein